MELLYGINPVEQALRAGRRRMVRLFLKSGPGEGAISERLSQLEVLAAQSGLVPQWLPSPGLDELCASPHHQGVALECGPLDMQGEAEALAAASRPDALMVVADQVEDPQNLGAVARNCAVFGAVGLILPRSHSAPLSPAASKASAGWLEDFPVYEVANLPRFLDRCRARNVWVAGTSDTGDTALGAFQPPRPLLLILGSEGKGVRPLVQSKCDYMVRIPTAAEGSLNVASASAVLLYALTQNR
jgi:23S rRNA (guanosine2251-2'-O)-methyltransferase